MTLSPDKLITIGRLFLSKGLDTKDIASEMHCDEPEIYNALSSAKTAYRIHLAKAREYKQGYRGKARVAG